MTSENPSSGFPPPESSAAPAHRAPGRDMRPRSRYAIWTLVVTIVLAIGAMTTFMWPAVIPALLLGAVAMGKIKPQLMRGQVMVIVALVMAVLVGSCSYMGAKSMHDIADHLGAGALAALGSEDPDNIDKWIATDAREDGAAERIKKRFDAVVAAHGPYQGETVLPSMWLGAVPIVAPPTDPQEIGALEGEVWKPRTGAGALWLKAVFEDAVVRVELFLGDDAQEGMTKALTDAQTKVPSPVLKDLRFFEDEK